MDRPHITSGVGCMFGSCGCLFLVVLIVGCIAPPSGTTPAKPKSGTKATLEQVAFEAFQKRDIVRAEKLRALKGTKYDGRRMEAIAKAGADASQETWEPVAKSLATVLDKVPQDDQEAFDKVLESLAKAADRAGATK